MKTAQRIYCLLTANRMNMKKLVRKKKFYKMVVTYAANK